jgi:hypothetical protein
MSKFNNPAMDMKPNEKKKALENITSLFATKNLVVWASIIYHRITNIIY